MGLISIAVLVILVISAILLVLVILIQDEEGEGIGGLFGGGSSTPFGSRSGNVLTKFTAVLATIFLFCAFALAWLNRSPEVGNVIGKARQQSIQTGQSNEWWIQLSKPPTGDQGKPNSPAQPAGAVPAAGDSGGK